ncbi:MAG TPA: DUF1579 domain-containing protein [Flavobacterium sp.]|nr:DUF1579 domain-containing protein [Flavobacterium sp.]
MKKTILSLAALVLMTAACKKAEETPAADATPTDSTAVKTETAEAAKPMDSAAMMKAWKDYMTPGDAHKTLAMDNGNWDCESTMWMKPDDPNPTKTKMTGVSKMILGGRYQESRYTGMMMGQPFEGISTVAYNNASKQIESSWVDNMGTGLMFMKGDYDGTSKTMELKGECTDPMTGKVKKTRETYTIVDDNTRKMEMFDTDPSGKEFKTMEMMMTRKK